MRAFVAPLAVALLGATVALSTPPEAPSAERHFELRRSIPAADTVMPASPERIQLWFSQEPNPTGARIGLLDAGGDAIEIGSAGLVPDTATSLRAELLEPLAAGRYTVTWRAMAADGHVVTGEIPFTVAANRPDR